MSNPKIVSAARLKRILRRRRNDTIVFTNGCFDILHAGHLKYLAAARAKGDVLVVGLNSDKSVRRIKGPQRPVNNQRDRAALLAGLSAVDFVVVFTDPTPERLIRTVQPDVLVKGGDWPLDKIVGAEFVRQRGGQVLTIPTFKNRSTTNLIKKIVRL